MTPFLSGITFGYDMARRPLPSLAALKAFEAVADTGSFTRAAEELGITQAAVSRQMRALEALLGARLVDRGSKENALTAAGAKFYEPLREGLNRIEDAVRAVSDWPHRRVLTVSVAPFLSAAWLTPRVMSFIEENPGIDLRIHHSYTPPHHRQDQIDIGINWGNGDWKGVTAEKLIDGSMVAVCAPSFLSDGGILQDPAALSGLPLLYEFDQAHWEMWFHQCGVPLPARLKAIRISDSHALRRAALDGRGVALLCRNLIKDDLAGGRLLEPFSQSINTGAHYFLNYPSDCDLPSAAKTFRHWLIAKRDEDVTLASGL